MGMFRTESRWSWEERHLLCVLGLALMPSEGVTGDRL
jgi:hypothetical protein